MAKPRSPEQEKIHKENRQKRKQKRKNKIEQNKLNTKLKFGYCSQDYLDTERITELHEWPPIIYYLNKFRNTASHFIGTQKTFDTLDTLLTAEYKLELDQQYADKTEIQLQRILIFFQAGCPLPYAEAYMAYAQFEFLINLSKERGLNKSTDFQVLRKGCVIPLG